MTENVQEMNSGGPEAVPRAVSAERGWGWIAEGFGYFKKAPGPWVLIALIFGIISVVLSLIPLIGQLVLLVLVPILMGGLMMGCRKQDEGGQIEIGDLFSAFSSKATPLAILGAAYLVGMIVIGLLVGFVSALVVGGAATVSAFGAEGAGMAGLGFGMMLVFLISVALGIPLAMALWFAPALVAIGEAEPVQALRQSFFGCLKNIVPFVVFGVIAMVIGFIAMIPLGLGMLVWGPVVIAATYAGYKDIFPR